MNSVEATKLVETYFCDVSEWTGEHFGDCSGLGIAWEKCVKSKQALYDYIAKLEEGQIKGSNATREELKTLFGVPDDISVGTKKYKKPLIWKYKNVEYHFDDISNEPDREGKVWLIYTETGEDHRPFTIWKRESEVYEEDS